MAANPLQSMGFWRGFEGAVEIAVPMTVAGIVFFRIKALMEQVSMGRPLTGLEVFVLLGAMTAVISWAVSRQMFLSGRRKPIVIAVMATIFSLIMHNHLQKFVFWHSPSQKSPFYATFH